VNGRLFVNNVSLGVYGEIVQSDAYRDAKVQTTMDALPDLLGPDGHAKDLRFTDPDGAATSTKQLVLVSNNPYVVDRLGGFGSRPRMDTGQLGVVSISVQNAKEAAELAVLQTTGRIRNFRGFREWTTPVFEVSADGPVAAGIDGEFEDLDPPVRFSVRPGVLRVRVALTAPGESPAATAPRIDRETLRALWDVAVGHV
jgi:diacylglycerol kinase family enzyme